MMDEFYIVPKRVMNDRMNTQIQVNKEPPEATEVIGLDNLIAKILKRTDISEFEKANFFSLQNSYVTEKDGCQKYPPDLPAEKISIKINGKRKTVFHYLGCGKTILRNLGEKIDEVTNSKRWIGERK